MVVVTPVSVLVRGTFTFGTTAPDGSVTVPRMMVCCAKVENEKPIRAIKRTNRKRKRKGFATKTIFLTDEERTLIGTPPHPTAIGNAVNVNGAFHWCKELSSTFFDRSDL